MPCSGTAGAAATGAAATGPASTAAALEPLVDGACWEEPLAACVSPPPATGLPAGGTCTLPPAVGTAASLAMEPRRNVQLAINGSWMLCSGGEALESASGCGVRGGCHGSSAVVSCACGAAGGVAAAPPRR